MRDIGHALEVDRARIGRGAAHDQLGLELVGHALDGVVVDRLVVGQAVAVEIVQAAAEVHGRAVREMPAVVEAHAEHRIARLDEREIGGQVGVGAAVGLHVGEFRAEQLLGALAGELLDDIDLFAAAVVALARIAFGVFIRKDAAHGLHDGRTREVLRSDQLDGIALARKLGGDGGGHLGVLVQIGKRHGMHPFCSTARAPRARAQRNRPILPPTRGGDGEETPTGRVLTRHEGVRKNRPLESGRPLGIYQLRRTLPSAPMTAPPSASSFMIFATRMAWRPPSNFVARKASTIFLFSSSSTKRPESVTMLASLC